MELKINNSYNSLNSFKSNTIAKNKNYKLINEEFYYSIVNNKNDILVNLRDCSKETALFIFNKFIL